MMIKNRINKLSFSGQSLFEVVLALGIISFIIVVLISLSTLSVRNASVAKNKTQANRYAQEAVEWLRGERDAGYDGFVVNVNGLGTAGCPNIELYDGDPAGSLQHKCVCLKDIGWGNPSACGSADIIEGGFTREASLNVEESNNRVVGAVIVSWTDSKGDHATRLNTFLADWRAQP